MTSRISLVGTLLRKDLRLFGLFAALIAALVALAQFPTLMLKLGSLAPLMRAALQLGTLLLLLLVLYEDALVSLKHDWLTRPISGAALLAAKAVFVFVAVIVPPVAGSVAYNLSQGRSLAESLLSGIGTGARGDLLLIPLITMALAAVTTGIRQAVIVVLSVLAVLALFSLGLTLQGVPESVGATSSGWMLRRGMQLTELSAGLAILWVQYGHRRTRVARAIAGATVLAFMAMMALLTWPRVFAIQKSLASDPGAAATLGVTVEEGCFPTRLLDSDPAASASAMASGITPQRYSEEHRQNAGPGAIAFVTRLNARGVATQDVLSVNHVEVAFRNGGNGSRLRPGRTSSLWIVPGEGTKPVSHYWLLPRAEYEHLSAIGGVQTQIDYSLSLLKPRLTAEFVADGRRSYYRGIGYCGATVDRGIDAVNVDCFVPGAQPALLVANLDGASAAAAVSSRPPDFTPASLDFWGGVRHFMKLPAPGAAIPRVKLTTYEARSHFDRQIVLPGVLGGPVSACPAP